MKKSIKLVSLLFVLCVCTFFVGDKSVEAEQNRICGANTEVAGGISCTYDFFSGNSKGTIAFVRTQSNGYCATVESQIHGKHLLGNLSFEAILGNGTKNTTGKSSFDVSEDFIKNAVNNKQCPKMKMVYLWDKSSDGLKEVVKQVVYSDHTGVYDTGRCAVSYVVTFNGSECAVNDGYDMKQLTSSEAEKIIKNQVRKSKTGKLSEEELKKIQNYGASSDTEYSLKEKCTLIDDDLKQWINNFLWIISIVGIIMLVILTAIEFMKVITVSEEDGLKTAFKHTVIRIVCVILLLLLPMIVKAVLNTINEYSISKAKIGVDGDPICGIGDSK